MFKFQELKSSSRKDQLSCLAADLQTWYRDFQHTTPLIEEYCVWRKQEQLVCYMADPELRYAASCNPTCTLGLPLYTILQLVFHGYLFNFALGNIDTFFEFFGPGGGGLRRIGGLLKSACSGRAAVILSCLSAWNTSWHSREDTALEGIFELAD